jgi:kumamolisin
VPEVIVPVDSSAFRAVPGSRREPLPGAQRVGPAAPSDVVHVDVVLRRAVDEPGVGAHPGAAARVEAFARDHGIAVSRVDLAARTVGLTGTVAQMNDAFEVDLGEYRLGELTYRGRVGDVYVPVFVAPAVSAVLGLDNRPQSRAHYMIYSPPGASSEGGTNVVAPQAAATGYFPQEVARRYGFPVNLTGAGQNVAVIELGGGYRLADLTTYFTSQGLTTPAVTAVSVDGAANAPSDPADAEVMLDLEVIGAVAQGAGLVVYFAPNTDNGFYDAIAAAIHDTTNRPSVISISWGQAEAGWTAQSMDSYDALFADAGAAGITVYAACGDDGANDRVGGSSYNVDFPASSPHVVGCGGTRLNANDETVWNGLATGNGATGGGVSGHFGLPAYQNNASVPRNPAGQPGRGVPDVAGDADPGTGYRVRVNGQDQIIGGTSAVAPLWAALTALANQGRTQQAGDPHTRIYATPQALRDIVNGNNGGYQAGPGWDACTGLGVPDGDATVAVLQS